MTLCSQNHQLSRHIMMSKQEIIEKIRQDWGDLPQSKICSSI